MERQILKLEKYGSLYSVSSDGLVISHRSGKPLKIYFVNGVPCVRLLGKRVPVVELVTEAFVPQPRGQKFIHHIDGNSMNNRADNLRWSTIDENVFKLPKRCTVKRRLGGKRATYHLRKRISVRYDKRGARVFSSSDQVLGLNNTAKKYNVPRSAIYKCCKGEINSYLSGGIRYKFTVLDWSLYQ